MVLKETLWKGFRNRAIFKAMTTEELVSLNTPITKIIHFTVRQRALNKELFFKVIQDKVGYSTC